MRKILPILLAVALLFSLVPCALAEEGPDAQANENLDDIWLLVYFEGEDVPTVVRSDKLMENDFNFNGVSVNWYDYQFGEGTGYGRWKISTLTALFEGLSKGSCTIDDSQKKIDISKPIELHFFNKDGANKTIGKKLVFASTSEKPDDAAVAAVDESDTITIYTDDFKFVNDSTAIPAGLDVSSQDYENNTITFEKGLEIKSGASVKFSHNANKKYKNQSRSWVSAQMTCVFGGDLVVDEGGNLSVEGHKAPPEWTVTTPGVDQKPYRGYDDDGTIFEFSGTQFQNSGDVTLTGVHVKGENMNNEPVMVNNGSLTLEERKTTSGEGARNTVTLVETDSTATAAIECGESSTLTVKDDSQIKSNYKKAADLEAGSTFSDGTTTTKVGEGYAESYVDNTGSLVLKANEDDMVSKVDKPSVEANVDKVSGEDGDKQALTEALGGITADLPMVEQNDAASEWANESKTGTVKEQMKGATGKEPEAIEEVYIHVLTIVETTVEAYDKDAGVLTLDITPYYEVVATTAEDKDKIVLPEEATEDETINAVELDKKPLQVEADVPMTIKLPDGFGGGLDGSAKIIIVHDHDGQVYRYNGTIDFPNKTVSFTAKGFSTFTVVLLKNGMLTELESSEGTMGTFIPSTTDYTVNVPYNVSDLTLTATAAVKGDKVEAKFGESPLTPVKGEDSDKDVYTISVSDLVVGENKVEITVTHGSGDPTTYTVTIVRAAYVPPAPSTYSVKVEEVENAEVELSATSATAGTEITVTVTPDENYHVSGVTVTAANGAAVAVTDNKDGTYTFTMPASNVTVAAEVYECPSLAFPDIDLTEWYHEGVDYAIAHNLMRGIDVGVFAPEKTVTRAEMAGILWNLEGQPEVEAEIPFPDVAENEWYTEAIRWAASAGIIKGYDTGNFGPNDTITREQMAAMLYFYEQKIGSGGFAEDDTFDLTFDDAAEISDWAREAVAWCTIKGVITGSENKFNPADTSKRSDLATILALYDKLAK